MKRRTFIKGLGACLGLTYINPLGLVPELTPAVVTGNCFVDPNVMASEALALLREQLTFSYIKPAMSKLANNIDNQVITFIRGNEYHAT